MNHDSRPIRRIVAILAVSAIAGIGGTRATQAVTLEEYRQLIAECRRAVEKDKSSEAEFQSLRLRLEATHTVTYPGGNSVTVDTRPLISALRHRSDEDLAKEQFSVLESLLTASGTKSDKGDPQAQSRQVLASKEFEGLRKPVTPEKNVVPSWWTRFSKWLKENAERFSDWLRKILKDQEPSRSPNLGGVEAFVKFLQFLLYFVLGVAAVAAIYLLVRTASARGWLNALRKRRKRGGDSDLDLDLSGDGIADPLGVARELAAKGAYRDAVRMAYIASLRRLQENGLLILEPNKTNWEYQRELRRRSRTAWDTLLPATRLFDRVWYGRRNGTEEEFAEAVRVHDALNGLSLELTAEAEETSVPSETGSTL